MSAVKLPEGLRAAAEAMRAEDDNLLRAIAMIAASGRIQIVPTGGLLGMEARPVICLPERMYDRLFQLSATPPSTKEGEA